MHSHVSLLIFQAIIEFPLERLHNSYLFFLKILLSLPIIAHSSKEKIISSYFSIFQLKIFNKILTF